MAVAIVQTANPAGVTAVGTLVTYSSVSIGTASADRIVVVCSGNEEDASGLTPSSATIDYGSGDIAMSATALASVASGVCAIIFYLPVPTGTTATIKITWSGSGVSSTQNHIAVYSVTGASTTLSASGTDTSLDMDATDPLTTGSITIPANGGFIAVASGQTDAVAKTWANATEDIDADAGIFRFTTAMSTTGGTVTVTCTGGTNLEDGALAYAVFNPAPAALKFQSININQAVQRAANW